MSFALNDSSCKANPKYLRSDIFLRHFFSYVPEGTYEEECHKKVESRRKVAGAIRSQVNDRDLQLICARLLHGELLVPVLM